jgi:hypothetical protein
MFSNVVLDIAIGLVFLYLVLSLLCTVVNEYIATNLLGLRAANLAAALHEILDDQRVRSNFYAHGIIAGTTNALTRSQNVLGSLIKNFGRIRPAVLAAQGPKEPLRPLQPQNPPAPADVGNVQQGNVQQANAAAQAAAFDNHVSYLASSDFALALLGSLNPDNQVPLIGDIRTAVAALPNSNLKTGLLVGLSTAGDDLEKLRSNIANWFDNSMDRLSGAYKRHLKFISIIVGVAVAVIFNADTLKVGTALWADSGLRAQIVQAAQGMIKTAPDQQPTAQTLGDLETAFTGANEKALPLPIGWNSFPSLASFASWTSFKSYLHASEITWQTPFGWFLTGLALSLGAPFWFDLLSKFMNLRGAGVKPKRADDK